MKNIKKYRFYLSIYVIVAFIVVLMLFAFSYHGNGFNVYILLLSFISIALITRIYILAISFYKELLTTLDLQNEKSKQKVTINDIINQKETDEEEELVHQDTELEQLVDNLSKETEPQILGNKLLTQLGKEMHIVQGLIYKYSSESEIFNVLCSYAYYGNDQPRSFKLGEGLSGQAARDKKSIVLKELPEGYAKVISGLGKREPKALLLAPFIHDDKCVALAELSFFEDLDDNKIVKFEGILNLLSKYFV